MIKVASIIATSLYDYFLNLFTQAIEFLGYKYSQVAEDPDKLERVRLQTKLFAYARTLTETAETLSGSEKVFAEAAAHKFAEIALI